MYECGWRFGSWWVVLYIIVFFGVFLKVKIWFL